MIAEFFSLIYYGLGLSNQDSAVDMMNNMRWPDETKTYINDAYVHLFISFYICILSAYIVFSTPTLFSIFSSFFMVFIDFGVESIVQCGKIFNRIDSEGTFSPQRLAWASYCCFLGGLASSALLQGPSTAKMAIHLTFFIILTLLIISLKAPLGKFTNWAKNLRVFEVFVLLGTIGNSLFPLTSSLGAISFSLNIYGGLILSQLFFLCHSQEMHMAANEADTSNPFSAPARSVPMLLDAISIFSRIIVFVPRKGSIL